MMIDGIKGFVNGLLTGKPVLRADFVTDYTERILNPRVKRDDLPPPEPEPEPEPEPRAVWEQNWFDEPIQPPQQQPEISRARAIFNAAPETQSYDPNDFGFALAETDDAVQSIPPVKRETNPARPIQQAKPKQQLIMGMTPVQVAIIAALGLALLCVLAAFAYVVTTF
jgi:hypothetical protein